MNPPQENGLIHYGFEPKDAPWAMNQEQPWMNKSTHNHVINPSQKMVDGQMVWCKTKWSNPPSWEIRVSIPRPMHMTHGHN